MIVLYLLLLAHLVVDFMQPAALVKLSKGNSWGLIVHSGIYLFLTAPVLFVYSSQWWFWAILLGFSHFFIDSYKYRRLPSPNIYFFILDQLIHFLVIYGVVYWARLYSSSPFLGLGQRQISYLVGYVGAAFGGSILVFEALNTFLSSGESGSSGGNVITFADRCLGMVERSLILTFILFDRYWLIPIAFLPSLIIRGKEWLAGERARLILELTLSFTLALSIGFWLYAR